MKKNLIIFVLLLLGILYILISISRPELYLNEISMKVKNPISLELLYLNIDTGLAEKSTEDVYKISLLPLYLLMIISLILIFVKKNK